MIGTTQRQKTAQTMPKQYEDKYTSTMNGYIEPKPLAMSTRRNYCLI